MNKNYVILIEDANNRLFNHVERAIWSDLSRFDNTLVPGTDVLKLVIDQFRKSIATISETFPDEADYELKEVYTGVSKAPAILLIKDISIKSHFGSAILINIAEVNSVSRQMSLTIQQQYELKDPAFQIVANARHHQIMEKGFTAAHDDKLINGELANAAAAYAIPNEMVEFIGNHWGNDKHLHLWPFELSSYKRGDRIDNLAKAGALILAEIARILRREDFPVFYYESNAVFGTVDSIPSLIEKCNAQIGQYGAFDFQEEFLAKSKQHFDGSLNFGTRGEHTGDKTLGQFLQEHKIVF